MHALSILAILALLCGVGLVRSQGHFPVTGVNRLLYKDAVTELQWFYNTNMDSGAALGGVLPATDPGYLTRVNNVVSTFCPDPLFQG
jgi:hypothetical protein